MNRKRGAVVLGSVLVLLIFLASTLYRVRSPHPLDIDLYPNPISLFWVAISLVFLTYSIRALRVFHKARQQTEASDLTGRRRHVAISLAKDYQNGERARAGQHLLSAIAGIESIFIRPVPRDSPLDTLHAIYSLQVIFIFILINILAGANSIRAVYSWNHREDIIRGARVVTIRERLERRRARRDAVAPHDRLDETGGDNATGR